MSDLDQINDHLRAAGLNPVVIDEHFDFESLVPPTETNEQFLQRIMTVGCPTGALIQAFVIEGLITYCYEVKASEGEWDNGLINSAAWRRTGDWLLTELKKKYR